MMVNDNALPRYRAEYLDTAHCSGSNWYLRKFPGWYVYDGDRRVSLARPTRLAAGRTIAALEANDRWRAVQE